MNQRIDLGSHVSGTKMIIKNGTKRAVKYTIKNGEYGEISFTLVVGGEFSFTTGSIAPQIISDDTNEVLAESVSTIR